MEATKSMMFLLEQIKTEAAEYSRMGTKSLCRSVDEEWVHAPNQDGYNFDNELLLTRKSYVAWRRRLKNQNQLWKCSLLRLRGYKS
jgi:hypothetical protein